MADTGKKVEVRYGAFTCVIEGYDDPVSELREVLGLMQQMITDTPAMAQVTSDFDADRLRDSLDDGEESEPTPGVVVIRSSEADADTAKTTGDAEAATDITEADEADEADADTTSDTQDQAVSDDKSEDWPDHIAAAVAAARTPTEAAPIDAPEGSDEANDEQGQTLGAVGGLGALAAGTAAVAGAVAFQGASDDTADIVQPDADAADAEETREAFTDWLARVQGSAHDIEQPPSEDGPDTSEADLSAGLTAMHDATDAVVDKTTTSAPGTVEEVSEVPEPSTAPIDAAPSDAMPDTAAEDASLNIFADPVEAEPTADQSAVADTEPQPAIEVADAATIPAGIASETADIPSDEGPADDDAFNIFADPEPDAEPAASISEPEPEITAVAAPEPEPAEFAAHEPEPVSTPEPVRQDEPAPEASFNMFADPDATPLESEPVLTEPAAEEPLETQEDPVPSSDAAMAQTFDDPAPEDHAQEVPASEPTLQDNGTDPTEEPTSIAMPETDAGLNIFAEPQQELQDTPAPPTEASYTPSDEPDPAQPESTQNDTAPMQPQPGPRSQDPGFNALLNRVHGSSLMGAPGEVDETEPPRPPRAADGLTATDMAERSGATAVVDLLAASAAWLTLSQNKPRFTRREVMEVFDTLPGDHPRTLEARIKGFGKLVRSGTLILIDDGVFAMAQGAREKYQTDLS